MTKRKWSRQVEMDRCYGSLGRTLARYQTRLEPEDRVEVLKRHIDRTLSEPRQEIKEEEDIVKVLGLE